MARIFTSDHHFGHSNILRHCAVTRPYASVEEMEADYIERWNSVVSDTDEVWYLGDFSMTPTVLARVMPQLNGFKHLVIGNHDRCFKGKPQQQEIYLNNGFSSLTPHLALEIGGLRAALCHFPYRAKPEHISSDPEVAKRQRNYAAVSLEEGSLGEDFLVHGHVHQYWRARVGKFCRPELNVSVDAWGGNPVTEEQLLELYAECLACKQPGQLVPVPGCSTQVQWQPLHTEEAGD